MMATWCKELSTDCTAVLQGMTDKRLTETESCYGIEMNVEK
jgi:predicted nucleic acid-binding Zn ribbon protein